MPLDPNTPSLIFVRALQGQRPTEDQLQALDPGWRARVQAALGATAVNRRATLLLAKAGQCDTDRLLETLRGQPPSDQRPWPDPTPFSGPPLPRFPEHVLPAWLTTYIRAEARATQTPSDLVGMLALAVLSTACAGPIVLNPWGDWIEPLNLFTMVVLPPGHRKSAIFNSVVAPLHQFEAEAATAAAPQIALARRRQHAAEQALLRAQDAAALEPDDDRRAQLLQRVERRLEELAATESPVVPRLIADDCSPEKLAMLLAEQGGKLAILSPEGGIFDLIAGRYSTTGAPNLDHVLKGHAGDPIVVDRVGRPGEIVPRPALTIGLAVQPEVLRGLVARPGFHGRGLLARFLYAVPNATLGRRAVDVEPMPESIRNQYHRNVRALLALTHPAPTAATPVAAQGVAPTGLAPTNYASTGIPLVASVPSSPSKENDRCDACLPLSIAMGRGPGGGASSPSRPLFSSPAPRSSPLVLHFDPDAADRLRQFAEAIEPRLAPDADLDPIVDWASKLVGATARVAGLLHLASLDLSEFDPDHPHHSPSPARGGGTSAQVLSELASRRMFAPRSGWGVGATAVEAAVIIAEYLIEHARAAYAAMGLDPAIANVPYLLTWIRRAGRATFTRRDAQRAARPRLNTAADLDEALDALEAHGYIRARPASSRPGPGRRPSPTYDVHPSLWAGR